ncbi:tetratricopeptide repeat protein [Maribacter sp. 2307ULW6-5]|uniref:SH3 domain-containing protein n=1 Tax=Maribacter sp. 2307ULW6-5 TaxID=3386275 RepID=UPI0039BCF025
MRQLPILLLFLSLSGNLFSQNSERFNQATEAYNNGDYQEAVSHYMEILESGQHSAALYYNLGNAHYKQNHIASSIYYYEKALLLSPDDAEIKNNLAFAQNMTLDAIDTLPETGWSRFYKKITGLFTFDQWAVGGIVFMALFALLFILFGYSQYSSRKRKAFIASLIALFLAVASLAFAYLEHNAFMAKQPAIVFAEEIDVRSEPNENGTVIFQLHEGTKVNLLETLNDWKRIKLTDGKTGWLPSASVKALKDF